MAENLKQAVSLYTELVEVNGKLYKLQHPGNRAWLKLKQSLVNITTKEFDFEKLLDYAFENCVFPEGHTFEPDYRQYSTKRIGGLGGYPSKLFSREGRQ